MHSPACLTPGGVDTLDYTVRQKDRSATIDGQRRLVFSLALVVHLVAWREFRSSALMARAGLHFVAWSEPRGSSGFLPARVFHSIAGRKFGGALRLIGRVGGRCRPNEEGDRSNDKHLIHCFTYFLS
jgi:hypothetical protein